MRPFRFASPMLSRAVLIAAGFACAGMLAVQPMPPASEHAAPGVSYTDITEAAGLARFQHVSGGPHKRYIIEATGSGVGTWDFDNDGLVDIYLVNGSTIDAFRRGAPAPRAALYRNLGNGTFRDVTEAMGVGNERWGQGVCVGDIDNDGVEDIYVANFGKNRLYRHTPRGTFEDIADTAGVAVDSWSTGCAFGDYDGDGWLDLFVAGYVSLDLKHPPPAPDDAPSTSTAAAAGTESAGSAGMGAAYAPGAGACTYRGERVICGPRGLKGAPDHLFHNNHDGTFTEVSTQAGVADADGRYGFGVAWFDFDDDGKLDLMVANDSGPNYVYRNLGNGRFADVSYQSGAALDSDGRSQAHMGLAIGDYDNDGRDDIHITNFADDFNVLYHNDGKGSFSDVSFPSGIAPVSLPFLGWGTNFLDYDNDGWLDLFVANGHVYPNADRPDWHSSYAQRALLFRNLGGSRGSGGTSDSSRSASRGSASDSSNGSSDGSGGSNSSGSRGRSSSGGSGGAVRFEEIGAAAGAAITTPRVARGSAVADFDNDGGLDLVINTLDGPPVVARNTTAAPGARGHWLTLVLRGDPARQCPRDAIGSTVFVTVAGRRMRGEVASGRGQISQSDLRVHFGLGFGPGPGPGSGRGASAGADAGAANAVTITKLEVRWANGNGAIVEYPPPPIDAIAIIDQATGKVEIDSRHHNAR
jgi:hypothetical protein